MAAARAQIADQEGPISIQRIADSCELSIQTVYNLAGTRSALLTSAVDEHYAVLMRRAMRRIGTIDVFDDLREVLWRSAHQNPTYFRSIAHLYDGDSSVHLAIQQRIHRTFRAAFSSLHDAQSTGARDQAYLVSRLQTLLALSASEWVEGKLTIEHLRQRLCDDFDMVVSKYGAMRAI